MTLNCPRVLAFVAAQHSACDEYPDLISCSHLLLIFQAFASDLVRRRVNVIAPLGGPAAVAAKAATTMIPIVFSMGSDPVGLGLVASLSRPTGNITGVTTLSANLAPKQLEAVHGLVPT